MSVKRTKVQGWLVLAATVGPVLAYELLRRSPADPLVVEPGWHFGVVSVASILAGVFAVLVGVAGVAQRNVQLTLLSLSFTSLGILFTLHGLATPGFLVPASEVPAISSQLAVFMAAAWLALSSHPSDHPVVALLGKNLKLLLYGWIAVLIAIVAHGLAAPYSWAAIEARHPVLRWMMTISTIGLAVRAAVRYWQSYVYSMTPLPKAVTYAGLWIASAQWIITTGETWRGSWWLYHFFLLIAVVALLVGVFGQHVRGESLNSALRGLFLSDPVDRLDVGLSPGVRALVLATEARDRYTAGHSYRVAVAAVRLGQELRLSPSQLRALAVGGLVHDVGKIEISDTILNKPGRLTPEERAIIEQHPVSGHRMCSTLGFLKEELEIVRHHHERWDGTGYPDRLAGEQIPLLARIVAIVDVYDALTSARSYRSALSHAEARAMILEQAGKAFDPRLVEVWDRLNADGPVVEHGKLAPWGAGDPAVAS